MMKKIMFLLMLSAAMLFVGKADIYALHSNKMQYISLNNQNVQNEENEGNEELPDVRNEGNEELPDVQNEELPNAQNHAEQQEDDEDSERHLQLFLDGLNLSEQEAEMRSVDGEGCLSVQLIRDEEKKEENQEDVSSIEFLQKKTNRPEDGIDE